MKDRHAAYIGALLVALLRTMDTPLPIDCFRRAVNFALVFLPSAPTGGSVAADDQAWGAAVRNLRGNGFLIEDIQAGTFAPGAGLDTFYTSEHLSDLVRMALDATALHRDAR